jgi:hypothetical protein
VSPLSDGASGVSPWHLLLGARRHVVAMCVRRLGQPVGLQASFRCLQQCFRRHQWAGAWDRESRSGVGSEPVGQPTGDQRGALDHAQDLLGAVSLRIATVQHSWWHQGRW